MAPIKLVEILSYSSEDPNSPAENLLKDDSFRRWKCSPENNEKQASVTIKLEKLVRITGLDVGNEQSAFVEVLAGREGVDFQVLLVASAFMSPLESRNSSEPRRVRMFGREKLNQKVMEQKWDRIKVICTQPFNKNIQYGLSFIKVVGDTSDGGEDVPNKGIQHLGKFVLNEDDSEVTIPTGSLFAKRHEKNVTGVAAIRAASKAALGSISTASSEKKDVRVHSSEPLNAPDEGFYQLKKPNKDDVGSTAGEKNVGKVSEEIKKSKEKLQKDEVMKGGSTTPKNTKDSDKDINLKRKMKDEVDVKKSTPVRKPAPPKRLYKPFNELMKDVTFVMSGYQNPQRSNLRDKMLDMGAKYKNDWNSSCTHLICAFPNTPKYTQVKGKGKIVTEKWIDESHKRKIRLPWRRFNLEKDRNKDESEEEVWATELKTNEEAGESRLQQSNFKNYRGNKGAFANKRDSDNGSDTNNFDADTDESQELDTDDELQMVLKASKRDDSSSTKSDHLSNVSKVSVTEESFSPCKRKREHEEGASKRGKTLAGKKVKIEQNEVTNSKKDTKDRESSPHESESDYEADTDIDEDSEEIDLGDFGSPSLPDCFKSSHFYIYGCEEKYNEIRRYIIAFAGVLHKYMDPKVNFVITESTWDKNFEDALATNPTVQFVKPSWIWKCSDRRKFVPPQQYLVLPPDEDSD